jgi:hypothetical protein
MSFFTKITNTLSNTPVVVGSIVGIAAFYMYTFMHIAPTKYYLQAHQIRSICHLNNDSDTKFNI